MRRLTFIESQFMVPPAGRPAGMLAQAVEIRRPGNPAKLRYILPRLMELHPALRRRPVFHRGYFRWDEVDPAVPLPLKARSCRVLPDTDEMGTILERHLNRKGIGEGGYLWKIRLIHSPLEDRCWIILVMHHAIADMESMNQLISDLGVLWCAGEALPPRPVLEPARVPLWMRLCGSPINMARVWWQTMQAIFLAKLPETRPVGSRRSNLCLYRELSEETMTALRAYCRQRRVTVGGLLNAITAREIARDQMQRSRKNRFHLCTGFSVSMRALLLPGQPAGLGLGSTCDSSYQTFHRHRSAGQSLGTLARRFSRLAAWQVRSVAGRLFNAARFSAAAFRSRRPVDERPGFWAFDCMVSNGGVFRCRTEFGRASMVRILYGINLSAGGAKFNIGLTTLDGKGMVSAAAVDAFYTRREFNRLIDRILRKLTRPLAEETTASRTGKISRVR